MSRLLIRRAGAYVVDVVLLFLVLFPVGQVVVFVIGWQPAASPTGFVVWLASALNFSLPTWTYFTLSESSARGATVGKRLLGLRVVRVTGTSRRVSFRRSVPVQEVKLAKQNSRGLFEYLEGTAMTANSCAKSTRNACGAVRPNGRRRGGESWPNDPP